MEKARQSMRMDVRRAYYGLQLARDAKYVADDAIERLDKAIQGIKDKLAKGDPNVSDVDRLQPRDVPAGAHRAGAPGAQGRGRTRSPALRFLTGVETGFDIVDEPLKRPDRPLVADRAVPRGGAHPAAGREHGARRASSRRKALVDYNRARLFPDFGLGLGADFISTPSATQQNNVFANDPFNHFYYYFGLGVRWSLDLLPQAARTQQAEAQLEETRALERLALGNAELEVEKAYADAVEAKGREEAWDKAEHLDQAVDLDGAGPHRSRDRATRRTLSSAAPRAT